MKRKYFLALIPALLMFFGFGTAALASGEASGGSSGEPVVSLYTVTDLSLIHI